MLGPIDAQLAPGGLVIFGELHGTMEVPAFVALDAATLVVCGNLHARTDEPAWMGWHVRQARPDLIALDLGYTGGTIWCCRGPGEEGLDRITARWPGPPGVTLFAERHAHGWDGAFQVGDLTPSLPLVR